jgi:hypothetical protein
MKPVVGNLWLIAYLVDGHKPGLQRFRAIEAGWLAPDRLQ